MEMSVPLVSTWIEERDNLSRRPVESRNVRPFMMIACKTGEAEVAGSCLPPVFHRDNMVDLEWELEILGRDLTILTTPAGTSQTSSWISRSIRGQLTLVLNFEVLFHPEGRRAFDFMSERTWPTNSKFSISTRSSCDRSPLREPSPTIASSGGDRLGRRRNRGLHEPRQRRVSPSPGRAPQLKWQVDSCRLPVLT